MDEFFGKDNKEEISLDNKKEISPNQIINGTNEESDNQIEINKEPVYLNDPKQFSNDINTLLPSKGNIFINPIKAFYHATSGTTHFTTNEASNLKEAIKNDINPKITNQNQEITIYRTTSIRESLQIKNNSKDNLSEKLSLFKKLLLSEESIQLYNQDIYKNTWKEILKNFIITLNILEKENNSQEKKKNTNTNTNTNIYEPLYKNINILELLFNSNFIGLYQNKKSVGVNIFNKLIEFTKNNTNINETITAIKSSFKLINGLSLISKDIKDIKDDCFIKLCENLLSNILEVKNDPIQIQNLNNFLNFWLKTDNNKILPNDPELFNNLIKDICKIKNPKLLEFLLENNNLKFNSIDSFSKKLEWIKKVPEFDQNIANNDLLKKILTNTKAIEEIEKDINNNIHFFQLILEIFFIKGNFSTFPNIDDINPEIKKDFLKKFCNNPETINLIFENDGHNKFLEKFFSLYNIELEKIPNQEILQKFLNHKNINELPFSDINKFHKILEIISDLPSSQELESRPDLKILKIFLNQKDIADLLLNHTEKYNKIIKTIGSHIKNSKLEKIPNQEILEKFLNHKNINKLLLSDIDTFNEILKIISKLPTTNKDEYIKYSLLLEALLSDNAIKTLQDSPFDLDNDKKTYKFILENISEDLASNNQRIKDLRTYSENIKSIFNMLSDDMFNKLNDISKESLVKKIYEGCQPKITPSEKFPEEILKFQINYSIENNQNNQNIQNIQNNQEDTRYYKKNLNHLALMFKDSSLKNLNNKEKFEIINNLCSQYNPSKTDPKIFERKIKIIEYLKHIQNPNQNPNLTKNIINSNINLLQKENNNNNNNPELSEDINTLKFFHKILETQNYHTEYKDFFDSCNTNNINDIIKESNKLLISEDAFDTHKNHYSDSKNNNQQSTLENCKTMKEKKEQQQK